MSVPAVLDTSQVAVITGGASGFGLETATRLLANGMRVAILDVSTRELDAAKKTLAAVASPDKLLALECNVVKAHDCVAAAEAVAEFCGADKVAFLFNNAGIQGPPSAGGIIADSSPETIEAWQQIFNVNVFGQVNILKAFAPRMIAAGPLKSGRPSFVVTTSSVVGLLNHVPGPYSVSKMAATAVCEQFSLELQRMGSKAAHVSAHSLHPTVAATNFLTGRSDDGTQTSDDAMKNGIAAVGGFKASDIIDGLFKGMDEQKYYIIVDHPDDTPSALQIQERANDMINGAKPRPTKQLASLSAVMAAAAVTANATSARL